VVPSTRAGGPKPFHPSHDCRLGEYTLGPPGGSGATRVAPDRLRAAVGGRVCVARRQARDAPPVSVPLRRDSQGFVACSPHVAGERCDPFHVWRVPLAGISTMVELIPMLRVVRVGR